MEMAINYAVDENGQIVDGDQIMFIIGQRCIKPRTQWKYDSFDSNGNLGFYKALEKRRYSVKQN